MEPGRAAWDQFAENERRFGPTTDYDENIYTTTIDKSHPQYKQRLAETEEKRREIDRSALRSSLIAEECITDELTGEDNGLNEEDKYGGVVLQDFPPLRPTMKIYTLPVRRDPPARSIVSRAAGEPAIISAKLAQPDKPDTNKFLLLANNISKESGISYSPLNHSSPEIRVLILQPVNINEPRLIECKLIHQNLEVKPKYEALSYTWGSSGEFEVRIDGQVCHVRKNLFCALRDLRFTKRPRFLWIDALCINQKDPYERNHQVGQMSDIYRQASRVIVWLEDCHKDDLKFVFSESSARKTSRNKMIRDPAYWKRLADQGKSMENLASKEYWNRLWTIQEFVLATDLVIQCGRAWVGWASFLSIFKRCANHPGDRLLAKRISLTGLSTFVEQRCKSSGAQDIVRLAAKHHNAKCLDPRDKIFGLLGLAESCCRQAIQVQYQESPLMLHHQIIEHFVSLHGTNTETKLFALSTLVCRTLRISEGFLLGHGSLRSSAEPPVSIESMARFTGDLPVVFCSGGKLVYINASVGMPPCGASSYVSFHDTDNKIEMYWKLGEREPELHGVLTKSDTGYIYLNTAYEKHAILCHIVRQLVLGITWARLKDSEAKALSTPALGIEPWIWPFKVRYEHYIAGCYTPGGTQIFSRQRS